MSKHRPSLSSFRRLVPATFAAIWVAVLGYGQAMADDGLATRTVAPATIHAISVELPVTLQARHGATPSLRLVAEASIIDAIGIAATKDGELRIFAARNFSTQREIRIDIVCSQVRRLEVDAAGSIDARDIFAKQFELDINGASEVQLAGLKVGKLTIHAQGAGTIKTQGSAVVQQITLDGSTDYDGFALDSQTTSIQVSGSSDANVATSKLLDVDISGVSTVKYRGDPVIKQRITGVGSIERVAD